MMILDPHSFGHDIIAFQQANGFITPDAAACFLIYFALETLHSVEIAAETGQHTTLRKRTVDGVIDKWRDAIVI